MSIGDEKDRTSWAETVAFLVFSATFATPSLLLNLEVSQLSLSSVAKLSLSVASVVAAPLFCHSAIFLFQQRKIWSAATVGVIFALVVGYNLATALGNVAMSRATVAENRTSTAQDIDRLTARRSTVAKDYDNHRELSKGLSPELAAQEVTTLRGNTLYARSNQCNNATVQDSIDLCTLYRGAEKRMLAAKEAARLKEELAALDLALNAGGIAPEQADPQVANVTTLASFVIAVDERLVSVLLNTYAAMIAELLGALSPVLFLPFAQLFRQPAERFVVTPEIVVDVSGEHVPLVEPVRDLVACDLPAPPMLTSDPVAHFIREGLRQRKGSEVGGMAMHEAHIQFCGEHGYTPLSRPKLSQALVEHGVQKDRGRTVKYLDLEIIVSGIIK